ncbi:MAG: hypothetical protein CMK09_14895 [Ponticaulis sp.]|nr:hypothetical protein [Ponticaulis sp.]|tara:strand:+ start:13040 stop:13636 length:597 start_codon:yes stop_codon:yes gene_type:complete
MKRILATTALATALIAPAFATPPANMKTDKDVKTEKVVTTEADLFTGEQDIASPEYDVDAYADMDAELDTVIEAGFTDEHEWVGTPVIDVANEPVGEIERVELDEDGMVKSIVVETGGIMEIGGQELWVDGEQYMVVADEGSEETKMQLTLTASALSELPVFDEDAVSDYPLSDDDLFDGLDEPEDLEFETETDVQIN